MGLALLTQKKEDLDADKTRGPRTSKCVNRARIAMTPIWCWIDTLCSEFWFQDSRRSEAALMTFHPPGRARHCAEFVYSEQAGIPINVTEPTR